jgi:glycosyltransferase involved in cell wall biosynthesis
VVARVSPIKDILGFVRACRVVAEERPDTDFVVLGPLDHDPAYAGRCLELADEIGLGERLRFLGEVDPAPWYPRLDVVVSPSVSEGQPLALLEAMAAGLPVVTTDVGGCAELVAGGRGRAAAGLVVAPASPRATGRAILSLCSDAALRQRMGAEGRRRVAARHRPEQFLRAYRGVYDRALARAA